MTSLLNPPTMELQFSGPRNKPPRTPRTATGGPCEHCGHSLSVHNFEGLCVMGVGTDDRCLCNSTPEGMRG